MIESKAMTTLEVGADLQRLRERAGKSQREIAETLAGKKGVDATQISKIESGKVGLSATELDQHVRVIGGPLSEAYRKYVLLDWKALQRPSFWNDDWEVLHMADGALFRIRNFAANLSAEHPLHSQLNMYQQTLLRAAEYLHNLQHDVVFLGPKGVGKSTAICSLAGLVLPGIEGLEERSILETGRGGTTAAETLVEEGPKIGLRIEPENSEDEVRNLIREICAALEPRTAEAENADNSRSVTEEVERALRNMAGLGRKRQKGPGGKFTYVDPLMELRDSFQTTEELQAEFFRRLQLDQRTTTQLWHNERPGEPPLIWLQRILREVNNGMRPDVPFPKRITAIVVPEKKRGLLGEARYEIRLADQRGLGETAVRPDIQTRLDDSRSILVLCSGFLDAPTVSVQALIEHANRIGARTALASRMVVLVLPRGDDACSMRDPVTRMRVETDEEGYELSMVRVQGTLRGLHAEQVSVLHLNADRLADIETVRRELLEAIRRLRESFAQQIRQVDGLVKELAKHYQKDYSRSAFKKVCMELQKFLTRFKELPKREEPLYFPTVLAVGGAHVQTVRASVNRRGAWDNLDIYLWLGAGTAASANSRTQRFFTQLDGLIDHLLGREDLSPTHGFLKQLANNAHVWREEFLTEVRLLAQEVLRRPLYENMDLWHKCQIEWGQGKGFQGRVVARLNSEEGFVAPDCQHLLEVVDGRIQKEWQRRVMDNLLELCQR